MELAKVLIVDDNQDLARALELRLRASNYQILLAQNGSSAVALALAERPFAILLDLHLKQEDGFAVLREFRSFSGLSVVPVLIVSADCSALTQQRVLDAGAHCFLEKPVNHRLLLQILRDIQVRSQNQDCLKAKADSHSA